MGFDRAGFRLVSHSEIDPYASAVLERHWPEVGNAGDIVVVDQANTTGAWGEADLWIGGPPCVGFSVAGQRGGLDDPRSGLVLAWFDLVERFRPRWLVFENVPGLFSSHRGRDFAFLVGRLEKLGYGVAWRTLDAQFFGVPQRRRRIFLVAGLGTDRAGAVLFDPEGGERNPPQGGTSLEGTPAGAYHSLVATGGKHHDPDTASFVGTLDTTFGHHGRADAAAAAAGHYIVTGPELAAPMNTRRRKDLDFETYVPVGEARVRRITPLEAERLQGWPDGHTIPLRWRKWTWDGIDLLPAGLDSHRYRCAGNGVATPVAYWVARRLRGVM